MRINSNIKKPKLLSPAGGPEALKAAVNSGADAVYLGAKQFSARERAVNFTRDEIEEAINYCHLRGVEIYLACNILYKNPELGQVIELIRDSAQMGADAFILQDIGLARIIKDMWPEIKLHASTQMTILTPDDARFLARAGFGRAILGRELSLARISEITSLNIIETEVFIHGALCVCYSGQCLMSGKMGGRSGNRGQCAQPCRLPYKLAEDGIGLTEGYLLSTRDLITAGILPEVIQTGVDCLKIEGRMKDAVYTAAVTAQYRRVLDGMDIEADDVKRLNQVFNRGGHSTAGYFHNHAGRDMMSPGTPKNTGILAGVTVSYDAPREICVIKASEPFSPGDGLEIWTQTGPHCGSGLDKIIPPVQAKDRRQAENALRSAAIRASATRKHSKALALRAQTVAGSASHSQPVASENRSLAQREIIRAGETFAIRIKGNIHADDPVYKTYDRALAYGIIREFSQDRRKCAVIGRFTAKAGKPAILELQYRDIVVKVYSDIPQSAKTCVSAMEDIKSRLSKTGASTFDIRWDRFEADEGLFFPVSSLNNLRREAQRQMEAGIISKSRRAVTIKNLPPLHWAQAECARRVNVSVSRMDQLKAALEAGADRIITEPADMDSVIKAADICHNYGAELFLAPPLAGNVKAFVNLPADGYYARSWGHIVSLSDMKKPVIADYSIQAFNKHSIAYIKQFCQGITLSPELELWEAKENACPGSELIVYGRLPLMNTRQCPIGNFASQKRGANGFGCFRNTDAEYTLVDRKGYIFPIETDCQNCSAMILNSVTANLYNKMHEIRMMPFSAFRIMLFKESANEAESIVRQFRDMPAGPGHPGSSPG